MAMKNRGWSILLFVSLFFFILNGVFYIFYANTSFDEGNYLYKGYLYATGAERPYTSGGTWSEYMPGSYFLHGLSQLISGPNFYVARFVSFVVGLLTVIVTFCFVRKNFGLPEASLTIFFITVNSTMVQSFSLVGPYSLSSFFLISSLFFLTTRLSNKIKLFFSIFLFFMAVFVRASLLPAYVFFILLLFVFFKNYKKFIFCFSLLVPAFFLFPFMPGVLKIFFNFPLIKTLAIQAGYPEVYFSTYHNKIDLRKIIISFLEFFKYYQIWFIPLLSLTLLSIFSNSVKKFRSRLKGLLFRTNGIFLIIVSLFTANIIFHFIGAYGHCPRCVIPYFNYYSVLGAIILAVFFSFFIRMSVDKFFPNLIIILSILIVSFVGVGTLSNAINTPFSKTPIQQIIMSSEQLKKDTLSSDKIFSLTDPHYLFLSERRGFGPLVNKEYGLRYSENSNLLENAGLWNIKMAKSWIEKESDYVLITDSSLTSLNSVGYKLGDELLVEINKYYFIYKIYENAWAGKLLLYQRSAK